MSSGRAASTIESNVLLRICTLRLGAWLRWSVMIQSSLILCCICTGVVQVPPRSLSIAPGYSACHQSSQWPKRCSALLLSPPPSLKFTCTNVKELFRPEEPLHSSSLEKNGSSVKWIRLLGFVGSSHSSAGAPDEVQRFSSWSASYTRLTVATTN